MPVCLQALSDASLRLCSAHSAGISLVEEDAGRPVFRWHAVSGRFAPLIWSILPREFSPCGTVLDRSASHLITLPERHFPYIADLSPQVVEVLLVPFALGEVNVGTVRIVSHDEQRRFDREDRRVVGKLAKLASVAYAGLASLSTMDVVRLARLSKNRRVVPALPSRGIQRRVLLVDPDPRSSDALVALLEKLGHEVHVTPDVRRSYELCGQLRANVVLIDAASGMDEGSAAARRMREAHGAAVRIFMFSGRRVTALSRADVVFEEHLPRPLDQHLLETLLNRD